MNRHFIRFINSPTLMSWLNLSTRVLSSVLVLPFVLRNFNTAEIALWYLFSSIMLIQILCDFGFNDSFIRVIAYGLGGAKKDEIGIQKKARFELRDPNYETIELAWYVIKKVYFKLTIVLLFAYVSIGTFVLYKTVNQLNDPIIGWYAWSIIIVCAAINFYGNIYSNFLQGMNRVALVSRWGAIFSVFNILTSFLVLLFHGGILQLVIANQAWTVINVFRNFFLSRYIDNGILKTFVNPIIDKEVFKSIWTSAWRSGIGVLMSNVVMQASGLIFAQIGSVNEVASYLFSYRLMQTISSFALPPFYSKLPQLARLRAEGNIKELVLSSQRGMRLTYYSFLFAFIVIGLSSDYLLKLIHSHAQFVSPELWILMGLGFLIERYGAMHIQLYSTSNHIVWHIANGVTGSLYLLISFGLMKFIGVYAFPLAMIVSYLSFYSWYSARLSYKSVNSSFFTFEIKTSIIPLLILVAYIIIKLFIIRKIF